MEKRQADGSADGSVPVAKRGRWDSGPAAAPLAAPGLAAVPISAPATTSATGPAPTAAAAAAALAAAVAAKYAQPPGGRPAVLAPAPVALPGVASAAQLSSGAAAAVAQAAAAALQKLPLAGIGQAAGAAPGVAVAPGPGGAVRPPAISLDALEKAKKALQLQKELQEKIKSRLPQLAAKLPAPAAGAAPAVANGAAAALGTVPAVIAAPGAGAAVRPLLPPGVPTALAAKAAGGLASMLPPPPAPPPAAAAPAEDDKFFDPVLARGAAARKGERRRRAGFDFVQEGKFQREAELFRLKSQYGAAAFRKGGPRVSGPLGDPNRIPLGSAGAAAGAPSAALDANLVPLGTREKAPPSREPTPVPELDPVPAVEWWDRGLLAHASLEQDVPELPAEAAAAVMAAATAGAVRQVGGDGDAGGDADEDMDQDVDLDLNSGSGSGSGRGQRRGDVDGGDSEMAEAGAGDAEEPAGAKERQQRVAAAVQAVAVAAASGELGPFQLKEARITLYVEHPVPLEPPSEAPPPAPQPLKLTARELKKLRTQRRIARDKEKQELIRQGLLEPPKPKVRIANLHRVLGTDAALDPTAVEKEVRKQMAERQAAHEDRNLARKLTPAERRDKKLRKLFGATAVETGAADVGARGGVRGAAAAAATAAAAAAGVDVICSVYRVGRLTDPQHRFKVDANARENHMTGIMVISDEFCIVVVEGVEKATRRYLKLMMRRIDWSTAPAAGPQDTRQAGRPGGRGANGDAAMADGDEEEDEEEEEKLPPNMCTLVWQGTVLRRAFNGFRSETVRSAAAGRQLLADVGVGHYWDAAAAATEGESVPYNL